MTRYSNGKVRLAAVIPALVLCACRNVPDYPVPEQSPSFESFKKHATRVVDFSEPDASSHVLRDILGDSKLPWRWTLQRPAVDVKVGFDTHLNYIADLFIPPVTFKDTGPVTVAFTVNDHLLDRVRYAAPGPEHFEKAVPPEWIPPHKDAALGAEIDKTWFSKDDQARLGFILSRIGLVEQ